MTWAELPLLRLVLPFVLGIVTGFYFGDQVSWLILLLLFAALLILQLYFVFYRSRNIYQLQFSGINPLLIYFICGALTVKANAPEDISIADHQYLSEVVSAPVVKGKNKRAIFNLRSTLACSDKVNRKIVCYIPVELELNKGDRVVLSIDSFPTKKVANPGEFNYSEYLLKQNISHSIFLKKDQIIKIRDATGLLKWIEKRREELIAKVRSSPVKPGTKALLISLVLGSADDMDAGIRQSFSASGTMHVLSVSGMHIALLYVLFLNVFKLMRINKRASLLMIIILVWLYSGLTGFSPSVLRAAVICTFMIIGEATSRLGNSMNLLCGSAILLLSIDPFLVFNPGFQLSYGAVAGILFYQRMINETFFSNVRNKWVVAIINACTVTIAAQIGTLGISLFYFGQFPVYFLFANLIIVRSQVCCCMQD
jgi:competence protein ComEC